VTNAGYISEFFRVLGGRDGICLIQRGTKRNLEKKKGERAVFEKLSSKGDGHALSALSWVTKFEKGPHDDSEKKKEQR